VTTGIQIFVFGLFKKVVLADHLAVFVDDVFYAPASYNTPTILLAAVSYSLQIYYDFSGYSDMAIGIAKTFGIALPQNFNLPYMASNVSEFWKRWHISLSSWLQEYVYIPLGGSRAGNGRTYVNLMAIMLISGLWHGNGWTFLTWGALYGVMSCMYRFYKRIADKPLKHGKELHLGRKKQRLHINILCVLLNFSMVTLFWIFFRADSMQDALAVIKGIFVYQDGISQMYIWSILAIVILVYASLLAYRKALVNKKTAICGYYPILDLTRFWALVLFFTFIGATIIFGYFGETSFIYGGF
jgi:alginate O-acetyltransferase complex protein AlgI